jgi:hypothetical protein
MIVRGFKTLRGFGRALVTAMLHAKRLSILIWIDEWRKGRPLRAAASRSCYAGSLTPFLNPRAKLKSGPLVNRPVKAREAPRLRVALTGMVTKSKIKTAFWGSDSTHQSASKTSFLANLHV